MRRRRSVRASLRLLGSRWMPGYSSSSSSPSKLSRRLPTAQQHLVLPNRGMTPTSLRGARAVRLQDSVADSAHPLPLTPEYQRQLQAARAALTVAAPVLDGALRPRREAKRRCSTSRPAAAPTLPPRRGGGRTPPPVPPRRKTTRLTTTSVSTRRQKEGQAARDHPEYENLDELLGQVAATPSQPSRPPPSPVRTYCRAPCRLKMMSLMDGDMKHTCVLPTHMPRPLLALSGAPSDPLQPCVAPCPLKLTSMLHGGQKHVCISVRRAPAAPASPAGKENEDPASPACSPPSSPGSFQPGDPCCRALRFPHLAEECSPSSSPTSSSSPVSIASAEDVPLSQSDRPGSRMTRASSLQALETPPAAPARVKRRSVYAKRTPSNASTRSDCVVMKQRRSLRWPAGQHVQPQQSMC